MLRSGRAQPAMRAVTALCALLLIVPALAASSARLADALAAEILRVAAGRPVDLPVPEDRTGRGPGFALDLHALVVARLLGHAVLAATGPRMRIEGVLTESPERLVVSARVVDEPGGRLVDVLSVSAETERGLLGFAALPRTGTTSTVDVISAYRTPPLDGPVLALQFLGEHRLIVLFPDAVALYRWDGAGLVLESRRALPGPLLTVRAPAGMLVVAEAEEAFWALTNGTPRAALFAVESHRLSLREEAAALPWPSSESGLRFRAGTNLVEGRLVQLGAGPFLALDGSFAVSPEGRLLPDEPSDLRVGAALAVLWPGAVAATSAAPPGERDAILILGVEGTGVRLLDSLPVDGGAVRALARQARGRGERLVAAVAGPDGECHLLVFDLGRGSP